MNWRAFSLSVILGTVGGSTVSFVIPGAHSNRSGGFTDSDAVHLEERISLKIRQLNHKLCIRIPPRDVRLRISKAEGWISQRDPLFTPGSLQWNSGQCE